MRKKTFRWTDERTKMLHTLVGYGWSIHRIANFFQTSINSVDYKIKAEGDALLKKRLTTGSRVIPPGTRKVVNQWIMEFNGRNWRQIGTI